MPDKPEYILPDWTSFNFKEENVRKAYAAANGFIRQLLLDQSSGEREKAFSSIKEKNAPLLKKMGPLNAEMWSNFVSRVQEECPSLNERELESVATILAKLEVSKSQYSLLEKVRDCSSDDFDSMDKLLESWSVQTAKIVLDELQNRLSLIAELEKRINDPKTDEVHDLQPIFDRALWIFGPEFESIEFESNKTMATVISNLLKKKKVKGSSRRPDFVALPDGSVGFYSRPSYDEAHEADKVAALVIVELKKPTVSLGRKERNQCEDYVVELRETGSITADTKVTCFLLGTTIKAFEEEEAKKGNMTLRPMLYETVIGRAKARTLFLYNRVKEAPFLNQSELANYLSPQPADMQMVMFECTTIDVTPPKP